MFKGNTLTKKCLKYIETWRTNTKHSYMLNERWPIFFFVRPTLNRVGLYTHWMNQFTLTATENCNGDWWLIFSSSACFYPWFCVRTSPLLFDFRNIFLYDIRIGPHRIFRNLNLLILFFFQNKGSFFQP